MESKEGLKETEKPQARATPRMVDQHDIATEREMGKDDSMDKIIDISQSSKMNITKDGKDGHLDDAMSSLNSESQRSSKISALHREASEAVMKAELRQ